MLQQPGSWREPLGSGTKMKLGVAGEPFLPLSVISSDFFCSLQSGPNLLPPHLIPGVVFANTGC